jgi:hypothetical protein
MKFFFYIIAVLVFIGRGTASAGDFDGSKLLICATVDAMDCVSGEDCTKGRPGDIGGTGVSARRFCKKDHRPQTNDADRLYGHQRGADPASG